MVVTLPNLMRMASAFRVGRGGSRKGGDYRGKRTKSKRRRPSYLSTEMSAYLAIDILTFSTQNGSDGLQRHWQIRSDRLDVIGARTMLPSTIICPHFQFSIYFLIEKIRYYFHSNIILC